MKVRENDEFEITSMNQLVSNVIDQIDEGNVDVDKKIATDPNIQKQLGQAILDKGKSYATIKDKITSPTEVEKMVRDTATMQAGDNAAENSTGGDDSKKEEAENTIEEIKSRIGESSIKNVLSLYEKTGNYKSAIVDLINLGHSLKEARKIINDHEEEKRDYEEAYDLVEYDDDYDDYSDDDGEKYNFDDYDNDEIDEEDDEEENYEDDDESTTIDDNTYDALYQECMSFLEEGKEEFENSLAEKFDVSVEDVEDIIISAMRDFIGEDLVEIDDEVNEEFENEIDDFDGDEDGLLDHLTVKFELSPKDVELIYSSSQDLTECIISMAELVRKRRK